MRLAPLLFLSADTRMQKNRVPAESLFLFLLPACGLCVLTGIHVARSDTFKALFHLTLLVFNQLLAGLIRRDAVLHELQGIVLRWAVGGAYHYAAAEFLMDYREVEEGSGAEPEVVHLNPHLE